LPPSIDNNRVTDPYETRRAEPPLYPARSGGSLGPSSEIVEATRTSIGGAFNKDASQQERADARNKRAAAQKENMTKVQALLTDGQKNAWKELTGEPIETQYPARRSNN
jgi:hypothetical protein